ncbi:hypothetical protein HDO02_000226 [Escherichia coli]|nr:hypothetical protein [Escherichia coli]
MTNHDPQKSKITHKTSSPASQIACGATLAFLFAISSSESDLERILKMDGKHVFALAFAIAAAIAVNVALFGGLYLLVNP